MRVECRATRRSTRTDDKLVSHVLKVLMEFPTYGYRRIWAILKFRDGLDVNRKAVYRVLRVKRWFVHQRNTTVRPRVRHSVSRSERSNQRWATDITHIHCGDHGWGHLVAVIDCHDREIVGYEFSLRGRAREAERAIEAACLTRFGTIRPKKERPVVRSDNGLVFQSRSFRRSSVSRPSSRKTVESCSFWKGGSSTSFSAIGCVRFAAS